MAYEWIKAPLALRYVSGEAMCHDTQRRICERAHAGMIAAKADLLVADGREAHDCEIERNFWCAEGREALKQDWELGDFSTRIDQKINVQAFGVSFDFAALSELVPVDHRAGALRRITALNGENWISARLLAVRYRDVVGLANVERAIVEACQIGQISGRALRARCIGLDHSRDDWAAREWDIPLWFWQDFVRSNHFQDWGLNKAHGDGIKDGRHLKIELQGVHFHRSGLPSIGLSERDESKSGKPIGPLGRKPKYDWLTATLAVFGQIYRGGLTPKSQADVEKALIDLLSDGDEVPSSSTVRPYAKLIWTEERKP